MRHKTATTLVFVVVLLLVVLLAPTAGAERDITTTDTVAAQLDGLRSLDVSPRAGGFTFAGAEGRRSAQVETPIPFSLIGFELPASDIPVWFRTSVDGTTWTEWEGVHLHEDEGPDPGSPEDDGALMSAPVWVGEARHVQTRVGVGAAPEDVGLHLIDSMGHGRTLAQRSVDAARSAWNGLVEGAPAAAELNQPTIVTRSGWSADESLRRGNPSYSDGISFGVVHHTAGSNDYSASEAPAIVRAIYRYHTQSRGWSDIGYNFLIDRYGRVYEGRYGGMDKAVLGAHAGGFNTDSFGVALMGTFEGSEPPKVALDALAEVFAWKFDVHHVDAGARVSATSRGSTRYPSGTEVTLNAVSGHRDVSSTSCPGGALYNRLPWLRDEALKLASDMFIDPEATPDVLKVDDDNRVDGGPVTLTTRLRPPGTWTLDVLDEDERVVFSTSGSGASAKAEWNPQTAEIGKYTYRFRASGRRTATGTIQVRSDILERIGSVDDPVRGAVELSKVAFEGGGAADRAVIARDDVFADAMAGGPLAGRAGPLLFTPTGRLDARVRSELERVLPRGRTVYILGGEEALTDEVAEALSDRWTVERLGGQERTETAAKVAEVVRARRNTTTVMVARSAPDDRRPWADALAGGAYGASTDIPVLLTPSGQLTRATREALRDYDEAIVLGGDQAISDAVVAQLPNPRRVAGGDRAGTAAAVAEELWGRSTARAGDRFVLAGGYIDDAWTMALASAPLAASYNAPLLLANSGTLPPETQAYLERLGYRDDRRGGGWVLGETRAVGLDVVDDVARLLR